MTLLELLARHWAEWHGYSRAYQDDSGWVWASANFGTSDPMCRLPIAADRATAVVTEPKWKAQRAQAQQKGPAS